MAKARQVGRVLYAVPQPPKERPEMRVFSEDSPDQVTIETAALSPMAHNALTPEELEQRLQTYEDRAALRLPLFVRGETFPEPPDPERMATCFACGCTVTAPSARGKGYRYRPLAKSDIDGYPFYVGENECYCPTCYARDGWGDIAV